MTAPGLAMSRSLGDSYAHKLGCISEGEIFTQTLLPHDKIIIMGSDGIFQYLLNEEISDIVHPYYKANEEKENESYA
jgi:serine/threonine protein phosphatase PrpC